MGVQVDIVRATGVHAEELVRTMRQADVEECVAAGFPGGGSALYISLQNSAHAWAVLFDGQVAAIVGVDPLSWYDGAALIWALTGEAVERAKLAYMRVSRWFVDALLEHYTALINVVDARYERALAWLAALGFAVGPPVPHASTGVPFRAVIRRRA